MKKVFGRSIAIALIMVTQSFSAVWADDHKTPKTTLLQLALDVNSEGPFAGSFDTLIAAVLAADAKIVITLSEKGQRTLFAPTDDAFLALGLDESNIGTAFPVDVLTTILKYHIVKGRQLAEDVLDKRRLNTLIRGKNGFVKQAGGVLIDNLDRTSDIIVTDLEASNGILHVINGVLLPVSP